MTDKRSITVLQECIELQRVKDADYNRGTVKQADYYTYGINSILDVVHAKYLRLRSVLEQMENGGTGPQHESVQDSFRDLINYASFGVAWMEGKVPGQDPRSGIFSNKVSDNAPVKITTTIEGAKPGDEFDMYLERTLGRPVGPKPVFEENPLDGDKIDEINEKLDGLSALLKRWNAKPTTTKRK